MDRLSTPGDDSDTSSRQLLPLTQTDVQTFGERQNQVMCDTVQSPVEDYPSVMQGAISQQDVGDDLEGETKSMPPLPLPPTRRSEEMLVPDSPAVHYGSQVYEDHYPYRESQVHYQNDAEVRDTRLQHDQEYEDRYPRRQGDCSSEEPYPRRQLAQDSQHRDYNRGGSQMSSPEPPQYEPMKIRKKPGPKPTRPAPILKNDLIAKRELIKQIERLWGPGFIKKYIPKCHRPLVKRKPGLSRAIPRRDESNPMKWHPSVLKCILMTARFTDDKVGLKKNMASVVKYRIRHTGNKKPQLVTTDFDVIEDMMQRKWKLADSFSVRYKHLLMNRPEKEPPVNEAALNEYFKHLFGKQNDDDRDDQDEDEGEDNDEDDDDDAMDEDDQDAEFENAFELSNDYQAASGYTDAPPPSRPPPQPVQRQKPPPSYAHGQQGRHDSYDERGRPGSYDYTYGPHHQRPNHGPSSGFYASYDNRGYYKTFQSQPRGGRRPGGLFADYLTPSRELPSQGSERRRHDSDYRSSHGYRTPQPSTNRSYIESRRGSTPEIPLAQIRSKKALALPALPPQKPTTPPRSAKTKIKSEYPDETDSKPRNSLGSSAKMEDLAFEESADGLGDEEAFLRAQLQLAEANAKRLELTLALYQSKRVKGTRAGKDAEGSASNPMSLE